MKLTRTKKLALNSTTSIIYEVILVIYNFIVPQLYLSYYGSKVNGLASSIAQFLGFISLAELGVGAVVQSAFYKPLAQKNNEEISKVYKSSARFFRAVGVVLICYTTVLIFVFPYTVSADFSFMYTGCLILAMSISYFAQYFLGMTYNLLLNADQMGFLQNIASVLTVTISMILTVYLTTNGYSIQLVKLVSSIVLLAKPVVIATYVKRHYQINYKIEYSDEPIQQKWNGLAQHIAAVVLGSTDTIVLTIFSTLENVSIYSVYFMVTNGIRTMVVAITRGITPMLGNMLANRESRELDDTFEIIEWIIHTGTVFFFSSCIMLIVPFVSIYTKNITDVSYFTPTFATLITIAQAIRCIQLPYNNLVHAGGRFKETQWSCVFEAILNIVISVVAVFKFGLVGVAIGTIVAVFYRACYLAWYLSNNIVFRSLRIYFRYLISDVIIAICICFSTKWIQLESVNYFDWIIMACKVAGIAFVITIVGSFVFHRKVVSLFTKKKRTS